MVAQNIVVGYDGSPAARRALDRAADLAGYGSTLSVVSVARPRYGRFARDGDPDALAWSSARLAEAREQITARHFRARYMQPVGEPADALVATARDLDADIVVVGRHERDTEIARLGTVSGKLVRGAPCDVLVVR